MCRFLLCCKSLRSINTTVKRSARRVAILWQMRFVWSLEEGAEVDLNRREGPYRSSCRRDIFD